MIKSVALIYLVSFLLCLTSCNSLSQSQMQMQSNKKSKVEARFNYDWFTAVATIASQLGSKLLNEQCFPISKTIEKKVLSYDVKVNIDSLCIERLTIGNLQKDFYQVKDAESKIVCFI